MAAAFAGLPRQQGLSPLPAAAWFRNGELVRDEPHRAPIKLGETKPVNDPLGWARTVQEQLWKRLRPQCICVRAVCFSYQGREQAGERRRQGDKP